MNTKIIIYKYSIFAYFVLLSLTSYVRYENRRCWDLSTSKAAWDYSVDIPFFAVVFIYTQRQMVESLLLYPEWHNALRLNM